MSEPSASIEEYKRAVERMLGVRSMDYRIFLSKTLTRVVFAIREVVGRWQVQVWEEYDFLHPLSVTETFTQKAAQQVADQEVMRYRNAGQIGTMCFARSGPVVKFTSFEDVIPLPKMQPVALSKSRSKVADSFKPRKRNRELEF